VFDAEQRGHRLSFRVSFQQRSGQSRVEVSLLKQIAELVQLKPYQKVQVERVADVGAVAIDYIELSFRKQFLQRGNLWRFKEAMIGKAVHAGINANSGNVSATVQELLQNRASGAGAGGGLGVAAGTVGAGGQQQQVRQVPVVSGVVTPSTHFIFRSKSVRLIWLIQISVEMWELDQNGDMYFEKLLYKLITPLLEKWKALAVSHSLTVVFFARTMYIGTLDKGKWLAGWLVWRGRCCLFACLFAGGLWWDLR
jgi:DEP domain-containing protein 5